MKHGAKLLTFAFAFFNLAFISNVDAAPTVHPGDTLGVDILNYSAINDDSMGRLKGLTADLVVVASDGSISIPVVGTLHVGGKSTREISILIAARLNPYVRDPAVTVSLISQSQLIFLTGATGGTLPYSPGQALSSVLGQLRQELEKNDGASLTAIDKNGGTLTRSAIDLRKVVIRRDEHDSSPINGEELLQSGQPGPILQPGDTVVFASKPIRVNVRGDVGAPGPIFLYANETLEQAVLEAGGALPNASTKDASLFRNGTETPLPLGGASLRAVALNGDTIVVRAAPHITVIGQVPTPGEFTLKNGSTLLNALYVAGGPTKWANVKNIQVIHEGDRTSYNLTGLTHGDLSANVPLVDGDVVYVPEGHKIDASLFFEALFGAIGGAYDATHI